VAFILKQFILVKVTLYEMDGAFVMV